MPPSPAAAGGVGADASPPHPSRAAAVAGVTVMVMIWGTTFAVIRVGLEHVPPFKGAAARFLLAAALLGVAAVAFRVPRGEPRLERRLWLVHGAFSFFGSYSITYWSEQWVPSGLAAVLFATFPLWVAVLGHFWLPGERLGRSAVVGIVLGFLGVAVIFSEDLAALAGPGVAAASLVMLGAPLASALGNLVVKRWGRSLHPVRLNAGAMALAGVALALVAGAAERGRPAHWNLPGVGSVVYLAVFGSAIAFWLYFWLLRTVAARRLALIAYLIPLVAVTVGVVFLDEPVSGRLLAGAALVVAGTAISARR